MVGYTIWFPLTFGAKVKPMLHSVSHASKVMLKILQVRLQQFMNREFQDVQAGFIFLNFFLPKSFYFNYLIISFIIFKRWFVNDL